MVVDMQTENVEKLKGIVEHSTEIKRKRMLVAIPAFLIGSGLVALGRWVTGDSFALYEALMCGLAVASLALTFAERRRGLPTVDDLDAARLNEGISPLGLVNSQRNH